MIELVIATIKYAMAPLEVGPEFAFNQEVGLMSELYLGKFEI